MPTLYITEFAQEGIDALGRIAPVVKAPATAEQAVNYGASSTQSATLNELTTLVRLMSDNNCSVVFAPNPTATVASMRMVAGQAEYFGVQANSGLKIAVISNS